MTRLWTAFAMLLALGGCIVEHRPIPIGAYLSPSGEETVSAQESQLHFHIKADEERRGEFIDRTYDYGVYKDHISLYTMTTSGEVALTSSETALGVGRYYWSWDGEAIIRRHPRSGQTVRFTRHRPPP